ncbi:hypothetical protein, partial [Pelomonas sp. KK5]|uniref:hypothetical protein n=1 Tax=Pelomonas sp. KK5 TaxID=1855730 RepID=UPI0018E9FD4E
LLMDLKNKYDVEAGWKATKKALANPANRRMGLEARQLNPTLAKYSLAWGAVVLKDPLARGAMKACGLTEASLNDEKADTHKVVKYLEVFYEDDVSIYRDNSEELPKWVPAEIELTLTCWAAFRRGADGVKLAIGEATLVEGLLGEFDGVQEAAEATSAELEAQQQALTEAGKALRKAAGTGGDAVLPDTTALETAIGAHEESLRVRSETAQRLHHALLASKAAAVDPSQKGKEEALKGAAGALAGFQAKAKRVQKAAAQDADGLKAARLELGTTMAALKQQVGKARVEQQPPTTRPRSNAGAPKPEKVGG